MPKQPLRLAELVPVEQLNQLRRLFEHISGVPLVFTDAEGQLLTDMEQPLCYCGAVVSDKGTGTLCLRRRQWDVPEAEIESAIRAERQTGHAVPHRCRGGFQDAAAPIEVEGQTIGYAVFARTLTQPPDMEHFRRLAVEGGMAAEVGEQVARAAIVMAPERLRAIGEFLRIITGLLASAALEELRAERVLELEKLRDDLIHMVVHDLRTPLTSIIGSLQTVMDADYDVELAREFLPMAVSSAHTLVDMVSTLLDIHRMEEDHMPLDLGPTNLHDVVALAVAQVEGAARERKHTLKTSLCDRCLTLVADGEKLRRVLINLLGNAIKFTPDGGAIAIGSRCEPEGLTFWVSDTGPGIPPDQREHIFEKYGQVRGRQPVRHSTGLGLTFCKLVVEAHGGRIWVESELGHGSTFRVYLPYDHPAAEEPG
ncbi:PocR ligand-binding domain-containing protein [bacterium]|nr:PocR ligand-binding domain-containing protein [bacterium]